MNILEHLLQMDPEGKPYPPTPATRAAFRRYLSKFPDHADTYLRGGWHATSD